MKSKRQRLESFSKSLDSALRAIKVPTPQPYFHPAQRINAFPHHINPMLYHPTSYNHVPAYGYHRYTPYPREFCDGQYNTLPPENQRFGVYTSSASSNVPPIQALEAHVINCCQNCLNQAHKTMPSNDANLASYVQPMENSTHYKAHTSLENPRDSQIAIIGCVTLNNNLFTQSGGSAGKTKISETEKSGKNKFFRPFEDS